MEEPLAILGIPGSLRKDSYNRILLRTAQELMPGHCTLQIHELAAIPIFNQDHEQPLPPAVEDFKRAIRAADAVLFATPEYNYSIPGVLKNAIDWASRPFGQSAWKGKPAALMGASPSAFGTGRSQYHLRQVLVSLGMPTVAQPEVMIGSVKGSAELAISLREEKLRARIAELLRALADLTRRCRAEV